MLFAIMFELYSQMYIHTNRIFMTLVNKKHDNHHLVKNEF